MSQGLALSKLALAPVRAVGRGRVEEEDVGRSEADGGKEEDAAEEVNEKSILAILEPSASPSNV